MPSSLENDKVRCVANENVQDTHIWFQTNFFLLKVVCFILLANFRTILMNINFNNVEFQDFRSDR